VAHIIEEWLAERRLEPWRSWALTARCCAAAVATMANRYRLLAAVTHYLRLTLDQVAIEEKSNGIPAEVRSAVFLAIAYTTIHEQVPWCATSSRLLTEASRRIITGVVGSRKSKRTERTQRLLPIR